MFAIVSSLMAGKLVNYVKYRTICALSTGVMVVTGFAPYFLNDITAIIVTRCIFGFAIGFVYPLVPALIFAYFTDEEQRATYSGIGSLVMSMGGIVFQMAGGMLAATNWRLTFLAYLFGIISFIIILAFMKEPEKIQSLKQNASGDQPSVSMPGMVYFVSILGMVLFIMEYPMLTSMSSIIEQGKLGTAATAGIVLTVFTIGCMVQGATFGKLYKLLHGYSLSFGFAMFAIGYVSLYWGNSLLFLNIATFFVGLGVMTALGTINMMIANTVHPTKMPFALSIFNATLSVGGFLSSFVWVFLASLMGQTSIKFPFIVSLVVIVIFFVISLVVMGNKKTSASVAA